MVKATTSWIIVPLYLKDGDNFVMSVLSIVDI